ncbi:MAG: TlpA family protein disulfide reductase [Pseudomonadaceae bacterium]|nr:MAG: TlpA family protein disulfide reductase [Pseudomonadaceae bacterium]
MLSTELGFLALSTERVLAALAFALALLVGWLAGRGRDVSVVDLLSSMLLVSLVAARLSFVLLYHEHYQLFSLGWLDIRDGGFLLWPGLLAAAIYGGWRAWQLTAVRRPLLLAALIGGGFWVLSLGAFTQLQQSQQLPDMAFYSLAGKPMQLTDIEGPLVVNIWATWCPPCRREMPVLQQAQEDLDGVTIVLVNAGESTAEIAHFLTSQGLELNNLWRDPNNALGQAVGSRALPTTLFYHSDGSLADAHLGELSAAGLQRAIERLR